MTDSFFVVDRIVGKIAICECLKSGEKIELNTKKRPKNCKEGDVLREVDGIFVVDEQMTTQRKADLTTRLNRLFGR